MSKKPSEEYLFLFNTITDAIKLLQDMQLMLMVSQQRAEDIFIESGE